VSDLLSELEVLIVDCQTTGASPSLGSVLELGWAVVRADRTESPLAQAHWICVPEGERVSLVVRQLTGFDESAAAGALSPDEAWRRLRSVMSTTGPTPTAIHFARFELSFLQDWSQRFEPAAPFPIDAVCVHAIACRLYPNLPRRNLRALAGFLGHGLHLERRSLGHVEATAFIWRKLVNELAGHGVTTWAELRQWLAAPPTERAPRKRRYPLPPARYRALPDQPGVYRFLRSNGDVLYVGKATSLKKRVSSHFTKQAGATERALEMLTQVSDIAFAPTSTALEASLLETHTIKQLNPPYNVQLVQGDRGVWFASTDWHSTSPEPDEQHRFGPLSSRYSVRALAALARLLAGDAATDSRRAAVVGAPVRWGPDPASFEQGFALFHERHQAVLSSTVPPRQRALRLARSLIGLVPEEAEEAEGEQPAVKVWDGPRVRRHLERAVSQAYQVLRRAAWLCLLASSSVAYREPGSSVTRFLVLHATEIVESGDLAPDSALPIPRTLSRRDTQLRFDAARYDSLRILSTELKRILRDGGDVTVRRSQSRTLRGARLAGVLRVT
jgi:DNA polymerase III subunit epsilon